MCAPQAAAFGYDISVVGNGVTASGSITFPTDSGMDPSDIDLNLSAILFGNPVSFTVADLQAADWTGAAPNDLDDLVVKNLVLFAFVDDILFNLTDNGPTDENPSGRVGDALCTGLPGVCGPVSVTWTYTPQPSAPVSEPSTAFQLLAGLSATLAGWRGRRIWRACQTPLQRTRARQ